MKERKVPGKEEWAGFEQDLDVRYAHKLFFGKKFEEVVGYFPGGRSIERATELLFMPRRAFQYYVFAFTEYLSEQGAIGDSDAASCFLRLLVNRERKDPGSVEAIYAELRPTVDFVVSNQGVFDAPYDIYGSFEELRKELHELCGGAGA